MKWEAGLEPPLEVLPGLRLGRSRVDGRPLGRKLRPAFEAPVGESLRNVLADSFAAEVLEEPPADDLANLRLVVCDQVLGDPADDLGDLLLPLEIPVRHLYLAAREADDRRSASRPRHGDSQVLEEGMERFPKGAVSVQEVQNLVEEDEDGTTSRCEDAAEGFGPWRRRLRRGSELCDALVPGELSSNVDPGRFAPLPRIPGIPDEDADPSLRNIREISLLEQFGDTVERRGLLPVLSQVVERGQRVGLPPTELSDQGQNGGSVLGLS